MPLDQLLRESFRPDQNEHADPDGWLRARARGERIRSRRKIGRSVTAVATAAALVVGVLVLVDRDDGRQSVATRPLGVTAASTEVVAVVGNNSTGDRLVVLAAEDGHEIRTLANGVGITHGGIAVTPDGKTAYFTRSRRGLPCGVSEIASVPVVGGAVETVASPASSPVLSSDGTELAYARPNDGDPCSPERSLVLRDLVSGDERMTAPIAGHWAPWAFSPEGTHVLLGYEGAGDSERFRLAVTYAVSDFGTDSFDLSSPADDGTFLPDGRLLVAFVDEGAGGHRLVTYDETQAFQGAPQERAPTDTLFETTSSGFMSISSDASGDVLMHFGADLLQRWRPGDAEPTTIATDVGDAAWVPRPASANVPSTSPPTTAPPVDATPTGEARRPDTIVAVGAGQRLLELSGKDGKTIREISNRIVFGATNVTVSGDDFFMGSGSSANGCSEILTHGSVASGTLDDVGQGQGPTISPDGKRLAYAQRCGADRDRLVIRDLSTGDDRSWDLPDARQSPRLQILQISGWASDNRHLLLHVFDEPSTEYWYVDADAEEAALSWTALATTDASSGGPAQLLPLGATGRWLGVWSDQSTSRVRLVELENPSATTGRELLKTDGEFGVVTSDSSGRHLLLVRRPNGGTPSLYRWSEGDPKPTKLADGVEYAGW